MPWSCASERLQNDKNYFYDFYEVKPVVKCGSNVYARKLQLMHSITVVLQIIFVEPQSRFTNSQNYLII